MQVQQLMSQPVATCSMHASANTAAMMMWEHDCGAIPVTDEDGRLCGIVTDRDLCMAAYTQGRCLEDISVNSAMSRQVFSCKAGDDIEAAEGIMARRQIRRVPVVNGAGKPVGMLSMNDLSRHSSADKSDGYGRKFLQTLSSISTPRHQTLSPAPARAASAAAAGA